MLVTTLQIYNHASGAPPGQAKSGWLEPCKAASTLHKMPSTNVNSMLTSGCECLPRRDIKGLPPNTRTTELATVAQKPKRSSMIDRCLRSLLTGIAAVGGLQLTRKVIVSEEIHCLQVYRSHSQMPVNRISDLVRILAVRSRTSFSQIVPTSR